MYVSLGSDCAVKKRLDELFYHEKQVSQIFDWVLSDFNAVCYILERCVEHEPDIFNVDKLTVITKTIEDKYAVQHNDCYFISLHDASCDLSEDDAKKLVSDMYNRRLKRFLEYIRDPKNDLVFVGLYDKYNPIQNGNMKIHDKDVTRFFKAVNKLCPYNTHKLVIITDNDSHLSFSKSFTNRISVIDSRQFINMKDYVSDWYRFFLDWKAMFEQVKFKQI
jgi:hypothetical protein